ncbi:MAG: glycosyltransferase family 2 protein [Planctomycetota bacterium]
MQGQSRISVIMATYNGEAFLAEQLDSILGQSLGPMEIVCVDDGSSDRTVEILHGYEDRHGTLFRIFENPENLGSTKTFEKGCSLARGEFIAFSDQDDWWFPSKLERLHEEVTRSRRVAFAYSNVAIVNEKLETVEERAWKKESDLFQGPNCLDALYFNRVQGCTMLARKSFIDQCLPFAESVYHHDRYLAIMAPALDMEIASVFEPLIKYRQHQGNLVSGGGRALANETRKKKKRKKGRSREKAQERYDQLCAFDFTRFTNQEVHARLSHERSMLHAVLNHRFLHALFHYHCFYRKPRGLGYFNTRYARHDLELIFRSLGF